MSPLSTFQLKLYIVLITFLLVTWYALCRLFLGRRWLHQSLLFLISRNKFVMQYKPGPDKVSSSLVVFNAMVVLISIFVIWSILFGPDKNHGVILLPEGLIESIPEVYALLKVNLVVKWYFLLKHPRLSFHFSLSLFHRWIHRWIILILKHHL